MYIRIITTALHYCLVPTWLPLLREEGDGGLPFLTCEGFGRLTAILLPSLTPSWCMYNDQAGSQSSGGQNPYYVPLVTSKQ